MKTDTSSAGCESVCIKEDQHQQHQQQQQQQQRRRLFSESRDSADGETDDESEDVEVELVDVDSESPESIRDQLLGEKLRETELTSTETTSTKLRGDTDDMIDVTRPMSSDNSDTCVDSERLEKTIENINHIDNKRNRHGRRIISRDQLIALTDQFMSNTYPDRKQYERFSRLLKLPEKSIRLWYQNQRAKCRRSGSLKELVTKVTRHTDRRRRDISRRVSSKSNPAGVTNPTTTTTAYSPMTSRSVDAHHPFFSLMDAAATVDHAPTAASVVTPPLSGRKPSASPRRYAKTRGDSPYNPLASKMQHIIMSGSQYTRPVDEESLSKLAPLTYDPGNNLHDLLLNGYDSGCYLQTEPLDLSVSTKCLPLTENLRRRREEDSAVFTDYSREMLASYHAEMAVLISANQF